LFEEDEQIFELDLWRRHPPKGMNASMKGTADGWMDWLIDIQRSNQLCKWHDRIESNENEIESNRFLRKNHWFRGQRRFGPSQRPLSHRIASHH
jgi:hypothetical protein